jgi:hypothetical protein
MPGIVIGEARTVEGWPGELSQASLERARKDLEEKKRRREKDRKPKPDNDSKPGYLPEGFLGLKWSGSQARWVCRSQDDPPKWQVWERENWCDLEAFERC